MILITGAAGFIGSNLVKYFNDLGEENLILVDQFESDQKWLNLRSLKYSEFIQVDELFDHPLMRKAKSPFKEIYHMGACSDTTELNMDYLYENNTLYTNALIDYARRKSIPICYASSAATYGAGEQGYLDDHKMIPKLKPLNKYGYSKQLTDEWLLKQKAKPAHWYGIKFFNVFGPNEYHKGKMSSVVFQAFNQINEVGEVKLFKSHKKGYQDGMQLRDFVYVKDVVRGMVSLVRGKKSSGIYNMGTGKARSFKDLVTATFKAMKKPVKIKYIDMPDNLRNQYQYYTQADMSKFTKKLAKFKFDTLESSVKDYVQEHLMKDDPYLGIDRG